MMTHDTEGGDGPQHRSSVHIKLEHQGNLRMVQHGLRTIQTLHTSSTVNGSKWLLDLDVIRQVLGLWAVQSETHLLTL